MIKGQVALVGILQHLTIAESYIDSFYNECDHRASGKKLMALYKSKTTWVIKDLITTPALTQQVRDEIKAEINSDVLVIPALVEKISLLTPESREAVEGLIDSLLKGEKLTIELDGQDSSKV